MWRLLAPYDFNYLFILFMKSLQVEITPIKRCMSGMTAINQQQQKTLSNLNILTILHIKFSYLTQTFNLKKAGIQGYSKSKNISCLTNTNRVILNYNFKSLKINISSLRPIPKNKCAGPTLQFYYFRNMLNRQFPMP